jgi:polyhydroxybutyrate depolymerase
MHLPDLTRTRIRNLATVSVLALVALQSGCSSPGASTAAIPAGSSSQTISVGGLSRSFHLYRPASLSLAAPVPLVVMLHGGFGDGSQAERSYGWDAKADSQHFVAVYPDGLDRAWNAGGGCCGRPGSTGIDDVAFITQMVAALERELRIDGARVFATGMSNGAIFSYRLACDTSLFAAIGPVSGTMLGSCPSPAPISIIHIHGTADQNVPYNGGQGRGAARIDGPAVPDLNATWRARDRCQEPSIAAAAPLTTSTAACPTGRTVELISIEGAGHQWPDSKAPGALGQALGADTPSDALDATAAIWTFFAAHPRPAG